MRSSSPWSFARRCLRVFGFGVACCLSHLLSASHVFTWDSCCCFFWSAFFSARFSFLFSSSTFSSLATATGFVKTAARCLMREWFFVKTMMHLCENHPFTVTVDVVRVCGWGPSLRKRCRAPASSCCILARALPWPCFNEDFPFETGLHEMPSSSQNTQTARRLLIQRAC